MAMSYAVCRLCARHRRAMHGIAPGSRHAHSLESGYSAELEPCSSTDGSTQESFACSSSKRRRYSAKASNAACTGAGVVRSTPAFCSREML